MRNNNPFSGAWAFLQGLKLITQPGIRHYVWIPLAINTVLFIGLGLWAYDYIGQWLDSAVAALPAWLQWLEGLFRLVLGLALVAAALFSFTLVANLVSAPFNGPLAAAVVHHLGGESVAEGSLLHELRSLPGTLMDEIRKIVYSLTRMLPLLLLMLIPGLNLIASVVWLAFSAWALALQYLDYPMANEGLRFADQRRLAGRHRFLSLGFGGMALLVTMVPGLNLLVVPAGVAGAAVAWSRHLRQAAVNEPTTP